MKRAEKTTNRGRGRKSTSLQREGQTQDQAATGAQTGPVDVNPELERVPSSSKHLAPPAPSDDGCIGAAWLGAPMADELARRIPEILAQANLSAALVRSLRWDAVRHVLTIKTRDFAILEFVVNCAPDDSGEAAVL